MSNGSKTRVRKITGMWRVDYCLPYSGFLYAEFMTWKRAMQEAQAIEKQRMWI